MDPYLLGLALSNVEGAANAALRGRDEADKSARMQRESQAQMMDLALKNASLEDRQAMLGLEMMKAIPVRNEPRIGQALALAVDPFSRIAPIQAPGPVDTRSADAFIQMATGKRPDINLNIPSIGVGANMIGSAMKSGEMKPAQKPLSREETQAQSIEKLRGSGGRAPQSVESIVQPLEGTTSPYQNSAVGPDGVTNLQPETIVADPNAEQALNFVSGEFKGSPYSALRNPEMRRMMFDSMVRTGSIPGLGIQTGDTMKALGDLEQTQFLAAKQAAQMNQKSQETSAEMEMKKAQMQIETLQRAADLAAKAGASNAENQLKAQIAQQQAMVDILKASMMANRPRSAGAGKEDPNKKNYRDQLMRFQDKYDRLQADVVKNFRFMTPENVSRIVRMNPGQYGPTIEEAKRLYDLGSKWPDVRQNFEGFGNIITSGGGQQQQPGGAKNRAAELLKARGGK